MVGYYQEATICINGHVISYSKANYTKYCQDCGKKTVSTCGSCSKPIKGSYALLEFGDIGGTYFKPYYCPECGEAYEWTTRILEHAFELISLDDDLPDEHRKIIKDAIPDLITETTASPLAAAKYKKHIGKAAGYVKDGLHNLLIDVVSETVKKSLWG